MAPLFLACLMIIIIVIPIIIVLLNKKSRVKYPPGPMALPVIGHLHLLSPLLHRSLSTLSSSYGPLMYLRLGSQRILVVSSPEIASDVFKNHDTAFSQRPHNFATMKFTYGGLAFGFAPYGPYWTFVKRLTSTELLGSQALHRNLPLRKRERLNLIASIMEKSTAAPGVISLDLTKELLKMTSNSISMMMISKRWTSDEEAEEFACLVCAVTQMAVERDMYEIFLGPLCKYFPFRKRVEDNFRRFDHLTKKIITNRERIRKTIKKDDDQVKKDMLDILLDLVEAETCSTREKEEEESVQITMEHVKALVLDILVAATDTTAVAVEWALRELLRHPEKMKKAQEEVDKVAGSQSRMVAESDYEHLSFIVAIIKETFRLHPPLPLVVRQSTQECTINGFTVPSGVTLFVNAWAIGRDPKVWDNPMEFRPERFLTASLDVTGHHYQLLPFGSGRRRCPAINLNMQAITITLAALVQCFDWEVPSSTDMSEQPGLVVTPAKHLQCFPVARYSGGYFAAKESSGDN